MTGISHSYNKAFVIAAMLVTALGAAPADAQTTAPTPPQTAAPVQAPALTNEQLMDKYNSGQKLTPAEIQQLRSTNPTVRGRGPNQRLVIRRAETPATVPQESAYRKWLRSIGGKIK